MEVAPKMGHRCVTSVSQAKTNVRKQQKAPGRWPEPGRGLCDSMEKMRRNDDPRWTSLHLHPQGGMDSSSLKHQKDAHDVCFTRRVPPPID
eukprot:2180374-Amphidinium_carterae.2